MTNYSQTEVATCGLVALANAIETNESIEKIKDRVEFLLNRRLDSKFLDPETLRSVVSGITLWEMSYLLAEFGVIHHTFDEQAYGSKSLVSHNFEKLSGCRWHTHVFENNMPAVLGIYRVDELYNVIGHWVYVKDRELIDGLKDSPFTDWDNVNVVMGCLIHSK